MIRKLLNRNLIWNNHLKRKSNNNCLKINKQYYHSIKMTVLRSYKENDEIRDVLNEMKKIESAANSKENNIKETELDVEGAYDRSDWEYIEHSENFEIEKYKRAQTTGGVPEWDDYEASPAPGIILPDEYQDDYKEVREPQRYWIPQQGSCTFCKTTNRNHPDYNIDPLNVRLLLRFINERGQIKHSRATGTCNTHQRKLTKTIKRARFLGLLSPVSNWSVNDFEADQWPFIEEYDDDDDININNEN